MNVTACKKVLRWGANSLVVVGLVAVLLGNWPSVAAAAEQAGESWFEEVAERAGIRHKHASRSFKNAYADIMKGYTALGATVAVGDYNGDGFEDFFATTSEENGKNLLYRNNGDFTFTEVGEAAGVANGNDESNASADALWFDYNNDGRLDLLVVRFGHSQLFENMGDGTFKDVSAQAGLNQQYLNSIVAIAFDYDRDGYVDILLGNYFQPVNLFNPSTPHFFPESFETANNGGGVTLYHNNRDGTFTDVTDKAGLRFSGWVLDLGHADANHDGYDDLYVAVDFGQDRFFVNNGDGTFRDMTAKAIGTDTKKGMNADWGDFNNDGLFDVYVTNITDEYMREGNFLWKNNGDLTFTDVARETGTYDTGWGWAGKFFDYDNDGWLDLYVVNGWVSAGEENYVVDIFQLITSPNVDLSDARNWPPMGNKTLSGYQEKCLFHNQEGTLFTNEAARHGLNSRLDGRGVAVADFDNDGRLDLLVANANARPLLYRNLQPTGNHWVQFALQSTRLNSFAVGARLWVTAGGQTQVGFVNGGNGFASQSSLRVHFGLAKATLIERLDVAWPSGARQTFTNLQPDRIYAIVEGQSELQPFQPQGSKAKSETGSAHGVEMRKNRD
jgi:ASPIC and UnbV/FG-GAP-like repeat/FG-GAP repeat